VVAAAMRRPPSDYLKRRWDRQARIFEEFKRSPEQDDAQKQVRRTPGPDDGPAEKGGGAPSTGGTGGEDL